MSAKLGIWLHSLRTARGLSRDAVARRAGISRSTLLRWETGAHHPRAPELEAVLTAMSATPAERSEGLSSLDAIHGARSVRLQAAGIERTRGSIDAGPPLAGDLLKAMRLRGKMSLEEVARRVGIQRSSISRWEHSETSPLPDHLTRLLDVLGAEPNERSVLMEGRALLLDEDKQDLEGLAREVALLECGVEAGAATEAAESSLLDLRFLGLEARLWPAVDQHGGAMELLGRAYTAHALWLWYRGRLPEAAPLARRSLNMARQKPAPFLFQSVNVLAAAAGHPRRWRDSSAEATVLQRWIPAASAAGLAFPLLTHLAETYSHAGNAEAALEAVRMAAGEARRGNDTGRFRLACEHEAMVLFRSNRLDEALAILPDRLGSRFIDAICEAKMRIQLFSATGDQASTAHWITEAYAIAKSSGLDGRGVDRIAESL